MILMVLRNLATVLWGQWCSLKAVHRSQMSLAVHRSQMSLSVHKHHLKRLFTTNICMINLWTLALPAWLNTLHFAKNSMSTSTVSIYIHLGKLQLLELCHGTKHKKSFVSCQLDVFIKYLFWWWVKCIANIQHDISCIILWTLFQS